MFGPFEQNDMKVLKSIVLIVRWTIYVIQLSKRRREARFFSIIEASNVFDDNDVKFPREGIKNSAYFSFPCIV